MDPILKTLLPRGDYYEKTSDFFKKTLGASSKNTSVCIESIEESTNIIWGEIGEELKLRGGSSFEYIEKCAKYFDPSIKVEIEDVFEVKITGVTYNPIIIDGSFVPEIAPEIRFLQKIKPAYITFRYFDNQGRGVYSGI